MRTLVPVSYTHLDVYKRQGAIVVYDTEYDKLVHCIKMPPTPKDLLDFLPKMV